MKFRIIENARGFYRIERKGFLWWAPAEYSYSFGTTFPEDHTSVEVAQDRLTAIIEARNFKCSVITEIDAKS